MTNRYPNAILIQHHLLATYETYIHVSPNSDEVSRFLSILILTLSLMLKEKDHLGRGNMGFLPLCRPHQYSENVEQAEEHSA